jgi:hypothetical protein
MMARPHKESGFTMSAFLRDLVCRRAAGGVMLCLAGLAATGSGRAEPGDAANACPAGLEAAMADIRRGDEAAAANRWPEAARAFHAADSRLRELEDRCGADIAERASASIDELLSKKAAVDAAAPHAGCVPSLNDARDLDAAAVAGAARGQEAGVVDRAFARAEAAWNEAAELCAGSEQQRARDGKAAATAARMRAGQRLAAAESAPVVAPVRPAEARAAAPVRAPETAPREVPEPPVVAGARVPEPAPSPPAAVEPSITPVPIPLAPTPTPTPLAPTPVPAAEVSAAAGARPSFGQAVTEAATKAAGFLDRAVASAAGALGLPVETQDGRGDTLRVGTTLYTGDFRRDAAGGTVSGRGRVEWNNGDVFNGTLVRGKAEGRGTMSWRRTGSRYEGDWRNDLQNGRGLMVFGDGTRYEGDFVDGHLTGRGRYDYVAIGEHYEGEVADGRPHGRGTYTWKSGDRYEGDWRQGRKHGQGRYSWTDGSYWEGEYQDDERTENGRTVFPIQGH